MIVCVTIATMLAHVNVLQVQPEERIREPGVQCRVREETVDDDNSNERQDSSKTKCVKATEIVERPYYAIVVKVEEIDMLLKDSLARMIACPGVVCGALRGFVRGGKVCSCGPGMLKEVRRGIGVDVGFSKDCYWS